MSNVGDALTGSGGSGVTDPTGSSSFGDTPNLTDSDFAGLTDADIMGGSSGGPTEFSQISDLTNALTGAGGGAGGGAIPSAAAPAAAATGGDPLGASGGTQSNTTPGATPNQNQQQQGGGGGQHDPDHAPPTAVAELKTLLKGLSGQPTGPTGQTPQGGQAQPFALPTLAAGQTGARSPQMALPALAAGQTGGQSPGSFYGTPVQPQTTGVNDIVGGAGGANPADAAIPPGAAQQRTAAAAAGDGAPAVDAQGNPVTAAGTPAADTPTPPPRPGANISADAGGRQINVRKGGGAQPVATADLPTRVPHPAAALPTHKPGASPAPAAAASPGPATSSIINDISGISTGSPTALADLAQAAKVIAPLLPMIAGMFGGGGGGRRFGRFHGGRFTHGVGRGGFNGFRGGMNAMNYHGGQHPAGRGAWPYHHPQFGWHMHGRPPGPGWLPLHPMDAQSIVGGGAQPGQDPNQQGPDPNAPPKETDAPVGAPTSVPTSGAIPGVGAKDVDDYTRSVATKWGIDPDVASKILAQESSYGQARKPGDNGTSFGPFQLHFAPDGRAMGDDFKRDTGLDPRDPKTWKDQIDYAMKRAAMGGWTPWTTSMKKLGMNQWSGITTNRRFAGKLGTTPSPRMRQADAMPVSAQLPPSSQPMVAGP